jgi:hypothetical protein
MVAQAQIDDKRSAETTFDKAAPNVGATRAVEAMVSTFLTENPAGKRTAFARAVAAGKRPADLVRTECRADACDIGSVGPAGDVAFAEFTRSFLNFSPQLNLAAKDRRSISDRGLRFRLADDREVAIRSALREIGQILERRRSACEREHGTPAGVLQFVVGSGPQIDVTPFYGNEHLWYHIAGTLADSKLASCIEEVARNEVDRRSPSVNEEPYPIKVTLNLVFRIPTE